MQSCSRVQSLNSKYIIQEASLVQLLYDNDDHIDLAGKVSKLYRHKSLLFSYSVTLLFRPTFRNN